ncbi:MAG: type 4a pilus biogenesis protein PilO [Candidatus Wildermuthbacteria bacterium]|nr:type 4a pilus biogenesis protein PilO [Candidatus Wildermuthbacteria bacterium]
MKKLFRVILSVILLGVSLLGVVFFVWPRYQELASTRAQIDEGKTRLESGQRALAQLREVQKEVFSRQGDFEKIGKAIPQDQGLPVLYEHIQQLGTNSGLILDSIEGRAQGELIEGVVLLTFNVEFTGSYEALKGFLDAARRSARILNVNALDISSNPQSPGELQIDVELSAYAAP